MVKQGTEEKLREIFSELGEERYAARIARAIVEERKKKKFTTTAELATFYRANYPWWKQKRQNSSGYTGVSSVKIFVNKELENIGALMATGLALLKPEGRFVCISFHSLEDRIVKQTF